MAMSKKTHKSSFTGLWAGIIVFLLILLISKTHFMALVEQLAVDFKFSLRGFQKADERLFLIGIDDPSIQALGRWIWPRSYHAALLEVLSEHPPAALGFDVLFGMPDMRDPVSDQALVQMSQRFDALTYAAFLRTENAAYPADETWTEEILKSQGLPLLKKCELDLMESKNIQISWRDLAQVSQTGLINAPADINGAVRKIPMLLKYKDEVYPSFSLKLLMDFLDVSVSDVELAGHDKIRLRSPSKNIDIPINSHGFYFINFRSDLKDFRSAGFARVLKERMDLSGVIAMVGVTATGIADFAPTPLSSHTPLVLVHLNAIQNILQSDFLKMLSGNVQLIVLFVLIAGTGWLSYAAGRVWAMLGAVAILALFAGANVWAFKYLSVNADLISPILGIILSYLSAATLRYWNEEKQKRFIKKAFQHYVSPGILDAVLKDPNNLSLGGRKEDLTVLFSDIRGFSTYSEKRSPEEVVAMLNEYFNVMSEIVFRHGGTVDKFLGDGLMVIFGAPIQLKDDHALCAVRSAVEMHEYLVRINEKWRDEGKDAISIGIGINTGPMVVGNMGSSQIMNYTVVGDEVNLAARLEGLTRQFNVDIVISQATYERVRHEWNAKALGEVKVKGREKSVTVYEILAKKS